ncbi:protein odr-4 homolog isoform X3 [Dermacentor andersoni]|uniref:protein odr-4 homolog isoform X3 n=1 Tax=Dermacentor andersoni TaxID=34620 RepID=UPI002417B9BA|nr:protein odr-4 homolog isoform X3 [Dermacentor andersoni]
MGRTIAYDDHVQKLISVLVQVRNSLTVGVIIGQSTQQRDIVVHIASTPQKDDEESQEEGDVKQSHKSVGGQADIEEAWICQHAKQVTRMLPGGMDVLGLFAVGTPEELAAAQPKLRQVLFAVFKVIAKDQRMSLNSQVSDRIQLQICTLTRKITCKTFDVSDHKCTARPADWKPAVGPSAWHRLEASLSLDLWVALSEERCRQGLLRQIQVGLEPFMRGLHDARALLNGEARPPDEPLAAVTDRRRSPRAAKDTPQSLFLVDLLLPLAIKQDVYRSITSRCEIQCEDMLLIEDEQHDPSLVHELPKRVFAPLGDRGLTLCDYIFHGDAACDSLEALQELLGLDVSAGDIELDTEHSPESNQQVIDGVETAEIITEATEQLSRGRNMLIPIASAAIAALGAGISYLLLQD